MKKNKNTETEYEVFDELSVSIVSKKTPKIEDNELYEQALGFVIRNKKISINQLRKLFNVGYSRAKKVVEQLEKNNIIESYSGGGSSRVIKIPKERAEQFENKGDVGKGSSFHYVNHILKIPSDIRVIEEDVL